MPSEPRIDQAIQSARESLYSGAESYTAEGKPSPFSHPMSRDRQRVLGS